MTSESKFIIGIGVVTLLLVFGGIFFLSKNKSPQTNNGAAFDQAQLVQNARHTKGSKDAKVQIVEFADIQCPACKVAQPIAKSIVEKNQDNVYFIFYHYPLPSHRNSKLAAQAAEAAGAQGKFFEMVDVMYEKQDEWSQKSNPREDFRNYATSLGLDLERFNSDMESIKQPISEELALGNRAAVQSTPTFFVNGTKYPGVMQESEFQALIDSLNSQGIQATPSAQEAQVSPSPN